MLTTVRTEYKTYVRDNVLAIIIHVHTLGINYNDQ